MLNMIHDYKTKTADLSVALLVDDVRFAKRLSEEFRAAGIFPYFYKSLDEFWGHIKIDTPDFALIEASKVRENEMFLNNHPLIQTGELKCALWVGSSNDLADNLNFVPSLGYLFSSLDLSTQIRSLVLHGLTLINQDIRLKRSQTELHNLSEKFGDLSESVDDLKARANASNELKALSQFFRQTKNKEHFATQLDRMLHEWKGASQFSILTYDSVREQITCNSSKSHKKITLPDLWPIINGADELSGGDVKLALDLAYKYFAGDVVPIRLGRTKERSDIIALVGINNAVTNHFDWSALEMTLNGYYLQSISLDSDVETSVSMKSVSSLMAQIQNSKSEELFESRLAHIDLSDFYTYLIKNSHNTFDYKHFYQSFTEALGEILEVTSADLIFEGGQYLIYINKEELKNIYSTLTSLINDFRYHVYLADKKAFIPTSAKPHLSFINISHQSLLSTFAPKLSENLALNFNPSQNKATLPAIENNMI